MGQESDDDMTTGMIQVEGSHGEGSPLVEITAHIRADQLLALELLENAGRQRPGSNSDREQLIRDALDLLIATSFVAIRLPQSTASRQRKDLLTE